MHRGSHCAPLPVRRKKTANVSVIRVQAVVTDRGKESWRGDVLGVIVDGVAVSRDFWMTCWRVPYLFKLQLGPLANVGVGVKCCDDATSDSSGIHLVETRPEPDLT